MRFVVGISVLICSEKGDFVGSLRCADERYIVETNSIDDVLTFASTCPRSEALTEWEDAVRQEWQERETELREKEVKALKRRKASQATRKKA